MKNFNGLSLEAKAELFDETRRVQALVERLGVRLADAGYVWPNEERSAFDRVSNMLDQQIKLLAA